MKVKSFELKGYEVRLIQDNTGYYIAELVNGEFINFNPFPMDDYESADDSFEFIIDMIMENNK